MCWEIGQTGNSGGQRDVHQKAKNPMNSNLINLWQQPPPLHFIEKTIWKKGKSRRPAGLLSQSILWAHSVKSQAEVCQQFIIHIYLIMMHICIYGFGYGGLKYPLFIGQVNHQHYQLMWEMVPPDADFVLHVLFIQKILPQLPFSHELFRKF
jgi:hypothetical protein